MNISVTKDYYDLRIEIDGVLHVHIDMAKYLGMSSWTDTPNCCCIEFALLGGSLKVEYTSEAKWLAVLTQLEQVL